MSCGYVSSCQPSCVSYPVGGVASLCSPCGGGISGGYSSYGGAVSSNSLGIVPGAALGCVAQTPPHELIIQPPAVAVVVPGPCLVPTCEPLRVGGTTACLPRSSPCGGLGSGYYKYSSCN